MRLEINTNGSWRIVSIINPDHLRQVMDTVQTLAAFLPSDPAWKVTDGHSIDSNGVREVAHLDPRRHGLVWQERK